MHRARRAAAAAAATTDNPDREIQPGDSHTLSLDVTMATANPSALSLDA